MEYLQNNNCKGANNILMGLYDRELSAASFYLANDAEELVGVMISLFKENACFRKAAYY